MLRRNARPAPPRPAFARASAGARPACPPRLPNVRLRTCPVTHIGRKNNNGAPFPLGQADVPLTPWLATETGYPAGGWVGAREVPRAAGEWPTRALNAPTDAPYHRGAFTLSLSKGYPSIC